MTIKILIMGIESNLFDTPCDIQAIEQGYHDFKLLIDNTHTKLYCASKQGKYFIIKTTKDNSEHQRRMLRREYELSKGCSHPHIVNTITFESHLPVGEGIIMEYIEGRTLQQYLDEKPSKGERRRVFDELLSAVAYIHRRGIIHNDIKPTNILISYTDNSLKLIDFGLADNDAEFVMQRMGCTPRYASPELRERTTNIDARSDIYSIGVIMGELLGSSYISRRCMSNDPERRYANISALRTAYHAIINIKRVAIAIFVVAMLVAATIHISKPEEPKVKDVTEPKVKDVTQKRDVVADIESGLYQIYSEITDSISQQVYAEFAAVHVSNIWTKGESLRDSILAQCDNDERTHVTMAYENLFEDYYEDLMERACKLPYYNTSSLSNEEKNFYTSLIEEHRHYEPYREE